MVYAVPAHRQTGWAVRVVFRPGGQLYGSSRRYGPEGEATGSPGPDLPTLTAFREAVATFAMLTVCQRWKPK